MAAKIMIILKTGTLVASPGEAVTHADEPCPGEPEDPGGVTGQEGNNGVLKEEAPEPIAAEKAKEDSHAAPEEEVPKVTHQEDEPGQAPAQEPGRCAPPQEQESRATEGEPFGQGGWTLYDPGGEQDGKKGSTMFPDKPTIAHSLEVAGGRRHERSWMLRAATGGGHEAEGTGRGLKHNGIAMRGCYSVGAQTMPAFVMQYETRTTGSGTPAVHKCYDPGGQD